MTTEQQVLDIAVKYFKEYNICTPAAVSKQMDLDIDSLDKIGLYMVLEEKLQLRLPGNALDNVKNVGDLINVVTDAQKQKQGASNAKTQGATVKTFRQARPIKPREAFCDGCEKQCKLDARIQNFIVYPVIDNTLIKSYYDADGALQSIERRTCENRDVAVNLARKIAKLCDYHQK